MESSSGVRFVTGYSPNLCTSIMRRKSAPERLSGRRGDEEAPVPEVSREALLRGCSDASRSPTVSVCGREVQSPVDQWADGLSVQGPQRESTAGVNVPERWFYGPYGAESMIGTKVKVYVQNDGFTCRTGLLTPRFKHVCYPGRSVVGDNIEMSLARLRRRFPSSSKGPSSSTSTVRTIGSRGEACVLSDARRLYQHRPLQVWAREVVASGRVAVQRLGRVLGPNVS